MIQGLTSEEKAVLDLIQKDRIAANYFFKKISDPKWLLYLKERNFFSPEKAPGPEPANKEGFYVIPYWNALDYLERVSREVEKPGNEIYIDALLEIVKKVTEYHKQTKRLDNYHIWSSFIRIISNLPKEKITQEIIDLIPVWLDSRFGSDLQVAEITEKLFPKFLTDNPSDIQKAEQIIRHLTEVKEEYGKKFFGVNIYLLKEFFIKHLNAIAERCTIKVVDILGERIKEVVSTEYEGTLNSLYDYEEAEYLLEKPVELFSYILSRILIIKSVKDSRQVGQALESFFEESYPIFTKIALFVIGQNISAFKDLFWKVLENKGDKIFEGAILHWGDELKKVLENLGPLEEDQKRFLKKIIELSADKYAETLEDKDEEEREKWKAVFKQKIYKALSYDEEFKALYDEMKRITGIDTELCPAIGKIEVETVWEKSPLSVEETIEMDNTTLAKYLIEFRTVDPLEGPTVEALAETLKTAIKTNPQKFTENLEPFLDVGYLYITRILEGLREALTESRPIDYGKILNFVEKYINRDEFWQDKLKVRSSIPATHTWVISAFCYFITEGFQNKAYPVPGELFEKIEGIIHLALEELKDARNDEVLLDYLSYSSNTPLGKLIEAYIMLILKPHEEREIFKDRFIEKYEELLKEKNIEAYTLLGRYFSNFYYQIDSNFTINVVESLQISEETWEAFMEGYLSTGRIYKDTYDLMKKHYDIGLSYQFKSDYRKQLVQHISLAYLRGWENLEPPSLFYKLIEKFDSDDIGEVIRFFWMCRDYLSEDIEEDEEKRRIKERILNFWQFIHDRLKAKGKEHLSEKEQKILSNIVVLTVFLSELTEPYVDWLKFSAQFIKDYIVFSFFLNCLEKLKETGDRNKTAKIIGEILSDTPVFRYPRNKIKAFIKYLCETNDNEVKRIARGICEKYLKSGEFFLKETCNECE